MSAFKMINSVEYGAILARQEGVSEWILMGLQLTQEEFNEVAFNEACFLLDTYLKDKNYVSKSSAFWYWFNFLINSVAYVMEDKYHNEQGYKESWNEGSLYNKRRTFFNNVIEVQASKFLFTREDFKKMYSQARYGELKSQTPTRTPKKKNNQLEINLNTI